MEHTFPILLPPSGKLEGKHNDERLYWCRNEKDGRRAGWKWQALPQNHQISPQPVIRIITSETLTLFACLSHCAVSFESSLYPANADLNPRFRDPRSQAWKHHPMMFAHTMHLFSIPLTSSITDHVGEHWWKCLTPWICVRSQSE